MSKELTALVAGHMCLDVTPQFFDKGSLSFHDLFVPGHLIDVGPAAFSTGGSVSNTGLALNRLGVNVQLVAKLGDDMFGQAIKQIVKSHGPHLAESLVTGPAVDTSYTVVIQPPQVDRIFLHCPGANDTFGPEDVPYERLSAFRLFHFGYPPLLRRMYADDGRELVELLRRAHSTGVTVSLDLSFPDPGADAGRADWRAILRGALPYVHVFLPSLEETVRMLRPEAMALLGGPSSSREYVSLLSELAEEILAMGPEIVGLKLGDRGFYLRTASSSLLSDTGRVALDPKRWCDRELWAPCFCARMVGTTGAGDVAIAGFLSSLLRGGSAAQALLMGAAAGGISIEAPDPTSALPSWEDLASKVRGGWDQHALPIGDQGWRFDRHLRLWIGPHDRAA